jgi:ribosomal protein S18 acetylase RimI-like enzyme
MNLRNIKTSDFEPIVSVVNDWWGVRDVAGLLQMLFFKHFKSTSYVAEIDGEMVGFLVGFLSQDFENEAYIHFVGVHPEFRKMKIARTLYEKFFETIKLENRNIVRCLTSPINKTSIAFHQKMGFTIEPQGFEIDGIPVAKDYDGKSHDRILFVRNLD